MSAQPPLLCLHCERAERSQRPGVRHLRLCEACAAGRGLRRVYKRRPGWTPEWDAHLQRLVERARQGLPVCITDPSYVLPTPPGKRRPKPRRRRWPRVYRLMVGQA